MESIPASSSTLHYASLLSDFPLSTYPAISSFQVHDAQAASTVLYLP